MNMTGLAKMYDRLTRWERVALMLAAESRGDELEQNRLRQAAPVFVYRLPDYMLGEQFLNVLALIYITEQMEHVAGYWHAAWWLHNPDQEDPDPETWRYMVDVHAYMFTINAEAWRRFCSELHIDAAALTAGNCHQWMWILRHAEEHMPALAPTREEMLARMRSHGVDDPKLVTADSLLADWKRVFNLMAGRDVNVGGTGGHAP